MKIDENKIKYDAGLPYNVKLCSISYMAPHFHSHELEIIFCLNGHVDLVAGHQSVRIHAGEVFSVDYRDIHYIHSDCDNLILMFHLDLTRLEIPWGKLSGIFFACESCHCYPYQQKAMSDVKDIIFTLAYDRYNHDTGLPHLADSLINLLVKYFNWFNYENRTEEINVEVCERLSRVLEYCSRHYNEKISISQLAEAEHINRNYFSQFISKTVFSSFSSMIKYIRCYEAEDLLLNTDMPISEISYACGFSDSKYFYAAFKEWWNTTPAEHRAVYAQRIKKSTEIIYMEDTSAKDTLRKYITRWHIQKPRNL